ncbi:hypothetical protein ACIRD8_17505 [Streptomyces sp. NPDC102451]|uniref:hypothetical protein n=1 Tax=Streptomyces sp. NPDC102451 TaxID=3366177 RepID=UPI0038283C9C
MGTLRAARHRGAAVALLLPVIIGMAGCGAGDKAEAGKAVYGLPLAEQFQAATGATRDAGTAAFVSTQLRASYRLGDFGKPVKSGGPDQGGRPVEDAREVLVPIASLKAGRCATTGDTGLGTTVVVRPVDCTARHDLRVLAQEKVDRTLPGKRQIVNGDAYARAQCERAYAAAPKDWRRGGRYADWFSFVGESSVSVSVVVGRTAGAGGTTTEVTGDYTCYLRTA